MSFPAATSRTVARRLDSGARTATVEVACSVSEGGRQYIDTETFTVTAGTQIVEAQAGTTTAKVQVAGYAATVLNWKQ